jgi:hypothetical protein
LLKKDEIPPLTFLVMMKLKCNEERLCSISIFSTFTVISIFLLIVVLPGTAGIGGG